MTRVAQLEDMIAKLEAEQAEQKEDPKNENESPPVDIEAKERRAKMISRLDRRH